jgi:hypothetical protein
MCPTKKLARPNLKKIGLFIFISRTSPNHAKTRARTIDGIILFGPQIYTTRINGTRQLFNINCKILSLKNKVAR